MATSVYVVDSSFKRTQIKVTPGKYLREVLEEACKTRKLSPEEYALRSQSNKTIDLSQPFRLSGLSAGAKLQLVQASKSPGVVSIALQLPESEGGTRLNDKFPSNTSLWLVLRKYEDAVAGSPSQKLNLTQRGVPSSDSGAGRLMYEQPCLNLMGRSLETFSDLQKTLAQLGLNGGTVLIRLAFTPTQTPLEEAMKEISNYFTSIDSVPAGLGSSAMQGPTTSKAQENTAEEIPITDAASTTAPEEQDPTSQSSPPEDPSTTTNSINGISVYLPPTSNTPAAALQSDDPSVFEPTIDHAKSHQAALQQAGRNKRLLSDKELADAAAAQQAQLATIHSVVVRVRYPDQSQIETTVYASETAAELYARVKETLAHADQPFELRYTGTKTHEVLPDSSTKRLVRDFGFRGKVLVTLLWGAEASVEARLGASLKDEYRRQAKDLKVELQTQQAVGEEAHRSAMGKGAAAGSGSGSGGGGEDKKVDLESKMKKFLGFNKKK
ncbi:GLUT4 regulating protein TUG-domain-containing protein [Neohortaea acidophila]|uniref:GLUT4 regulating protein TUG-domain-containing protein n=1 Tax=Neohortaea acidophila TaxID=245834 RepID=A0A6A6PMK5_9PEZI|nr:GLUT4 regulating protein TUG-domain-containing protein [Neohortaea acidophila]KAF2481046.1 GLUT4 regulating protein TUG-domain-containing protein [Neohortaea acidophila]